MSEQKAIRGEVIFTSFRSKVDGSLSANLTTPELSTEEKVAMMNLQGLLCEILVFPVENKEAEVIELKKEMDHKSQSQKMRSVIFLLYRQTKQDVSFEQYYETTMNRLIEYLKRKLPPLLGQ
jgi:hypothetical protein